MKAIKRGNSTHISTDRQIDRDREREREREREAVCLLQALLA